MSINDFIETKLLLVSMSIVIMINYITDDETKKIVMKY